MARINIEDSIKSDIRFVNLAIKLGSMKLALGELTWAWMTAQKHFLRKDSDRCVPFGEWQKQECSDLIIEVGLAERRGAGVWIKGSEDQFKWLLQRQEAGSKGGHATADKKVEASCGDRLATDKRPLENASENAAVEQPLYSLLSSPSSFSNSLTSNLGSQKRTKKVATAEQKDLNKAIWGSYEKAYEARYHAPPVRNAKVNSIISKIAERLGTEAPGVVAFYLGHDKSFYISKLHDISFCLQDAEALRTQWFHNKAVTERDVKGYVTGLDAANLAKQVKAGGF